VTAMPRTYNLVIVGAGPAGMAAGIYGARMGLKTLILGETLGGMAAENALVENYPGFLQTSGLDLMGRMREQAERWGAEVHTPEKALKLHVQHRKHEVKTNVTIYTGVALLIATGCTHRKLGVPGEDEFRGRGVSYCATCDGPLFKGRKVMVVGGGNTAATETLYLNELAAKVYLVHRRDELRAEETLKKRILESDVEVLWNSSVKSIEGERTVKNVKLRDSKTDEERMIEVDGVFISVGEDPQSDIARAAGIAVHDDGNIVVNRLQESNIGGIYAAGDVTGGVLQIGTAVGEGITAAVNAYLYVSGGWYGKK